MRVVTERQLAIVLGALAGTPRVVVGGNFATPWRALAVLDGTLARYRLFALNAQAGMPNREGVTFESPFVGPGMRGRSGLRYLPCRLSLVPALLSEVLPPDVVLVQTSAPSHGTVSLGTEVNVLPAAIEAARSIGGLVIAQLNPLVPYTYGDSVLPCDAFDYAIEAEAPLASPPERPVAETSVRIGDRVAALIGDGATLQAGIGALQVDLLAQANATWVYERVHSGLGGQTDFVVGALHSPGGQAIIALPSWHPKADVSTVVPRIDGPVTSFQHSFIVSEQGVAVIWGNDAPGQAEQIINHVAHPSVRERLRAEAGSALAPRDRRRPFNFDFGLHGP